MADAKDIADGLDRASRGAMNAALARTVPFPGTEESVRVGTDVVEIARIENAISQWGDRFLERSFSEDEIAYCESKRKPAQHFAGKFAAKEAVFKALGLTWAGPFSWRMIEIVSAPSGAPEVRLHAGDAGAGDEDVSVSISHTGGFAVAVAVSIHRRTAS
mgnify:CR=1 FL=1